MLYLIMLMRSLTKKINLYYIYYVYYLFIIYIIYIYTLYILYKLYISYILLLQYRLIFMYTNYRI